MSLSIIIPVYNVEKYLVRCLESIKDIDFNKVEVILVDDGSSDSSPEICDNYTQKHPYIRTFHKENNGLSSARNFGIEQANGDYLCFLDSDDMLADGFITDILQVIEQNNPDLIDFNYCEERIPNEYTVKGDKSVSVISQKDYIEKLVKNQMGCQACFRVYKKEIFDDIRFPLKRYYEDAFTFWKVLLASKNIVHIDYSYYIYNIANANSITKRVNIKCMSDMKESFDEIYNGLYSYCVENKINVEFLKYLKINGYVYIGYKTYKESKELNDLNNEIKTYIQENQINIFKYKKANCDWKKYILFKIILLFKHYR